MLEITNLHKTYFDGTKALQDVNLSIGPGLFGLLGPNGAGKSSLMRALVTLQQPSKGEIKYKGQSIFGQGQNYLRSVGYLPQDFEFYEGVKAAPLLEYFAILNDYHNARSRRAMVGSLLELVHLEQHSHRVVSKFSGGMRRRFGIAVALLGDPEILIVDEPTAGLDPQERSRLHELFSELSSTRSILLSTHIVEDVANLCAQTAILANGQIIASGTPQELISPWLGKVWAHPAPMTKEGEFVRLNYRFRSGKRYEQVIASENPNGRFEPVNPDLEDAYFAYLVKHGNGKGGNDV